MENRKEMDEKVIKRLDTLNSQLVKSSVHIFDNFAKLVERVERLEKRVEKLEKENKILRNGGMMFSLN